MALTAPEYGGGNVQKQALPRARFQGDAPIEAFGGGRGVDRVFGEVRGVNQDVQQLAEIERRKADADRLSEERRALNDWEMANIYNPQTGALATKGKDAFGVQDTVSKSLDQFVADRAKNLTPMQQQAYTGMVQSRREHIGRTLSSHVFQQTEVVHQGELQAGIRSSIERAAVDPSTITLESQVIDDNAKEIARSQGMDAKMTAYTRQKAQSDLHTQVIDRMLSSGADLKAKDYYTLNGKFIIGEDAERIGTRLKRESTLGEAFRLTDAMFSKDVERLNSEGKTVPPPESMDQVRELTQSIKDDGLRQEVERQAKTRLAENRQEAILAYNAKLELAQDIVEKTGSTRGLPDGIRTSHLRELERRAFELKSGEKKVMDDAAWKYYTEKMDMAARPETRDQFLAIPPLEYRNRLPDKQFDALMDARVGLLKGDKNTQNKLDGYRANTDIINSALDAAGIKDDKRQDSFKRIMDEQIQLFKIRSGGKEPMNKDVQDMADELIRETATNWFSRNTRRYQDVDEFYKTQLSAIPAVELAKIHQALSQTGEPITRARAIELYLKLQQQKKK